MAADAFIQCRVTPEMKTLVRALAEREQITESALVKQLLEVVLRTSSPADHQTLDPPETAKRDARLYVRMDPEDRLLLASRARASPLWTDAAIAFETTGAVSACEDAWRG